MPAEQPVVLVSGASRGIGLSIAQLLIQGTSNLAKANVVTLSRSSTDALNDVARSANGVRLIAVQGDATTSEACQRAVRTAIEEFGRLDAVVFNAGALEFARLADVEPASFARQMDVNVNALVLMLHHAVPHLRQTSSGQGKVVFVSSGAAVGQTSAWGAYNAGKAAMNAIARTLANEEPSLAVWAVRPGVVETEMQSNIRSDEARRTMKADEFQRFETLHKEGKLLKPHQPGHVIAALAVRGTRSDPLQSGDDQGTGIGAVGGFVNWDAAEMHAYQYPQTTTK